MFKRLMIIIGGVALVLVFLFVLMNQGPAPVSDVDSKDLGALRVAVHNNLPKMGYRKYNEDELEGYEIDLSKKLAENIYGDEKLIDMKTASMRTALVMLNNKEVDCVVATQVPQKKSKDYNYSEGYYTDKVDVLFKDGSYSSINDFGKDKKIGVISKSAAAVMLEEKKTETKANFKTVNLESYPDAKEWLATGKIDAFCGAEVFLQDMSDSPRFNLGSFQYVIVTRKADSELAEKLQSALSGLNSQGITGELQNKWR